MKKLSLLLLILSLAFVACEDEGEKVETFDTFDIKTVMSRPVAEDANPEIIRIVPDEDNKAAFVAAKTGQLFPVTYTADNFTIDAPVQIVTDALNEEATSIDISVKVGGVNYVAVLIAKVDCQPGAVALVNFQTGQIVKRIDGIGYNPDGCAFTKDGKWLVIACEDDREDRACKPADRWGGSVTIIDLRNGVANASIAQNYLVNHSEDSEPEHAETNADGDVVISVQEPSELLVFNVNDLPLTADKVTIVQIPQCSKGIDAEPDGLFISPDGTLALISNERNGTFMMLDIATKSFLGGARIVEDDLPSGWPRDARKATKRTEPEEASLVERDGKLYALLACQEASCVIVYDVTDAANPVFDSLAPAGIAFEDDTDENDESIIGSEGLGAHPTNGIVFSANEREGSVTMYNAIWARD